MMNLPKKGDQHDISFMEVALEVGRRALPRCLPNPPVGCALVVDGQVVATGFTQPPGQAHAEVMAINALATKRRNVTVYVTLEPCSFVGRTPSCAHALIASKVDRVVVGLIDPDPRNNGAGIALLRSADIEVLTGVLEDRARRDLGPYLVA